MGGSSVSAKRRHSVSGARNATARSGVATKRARSVASATSASPTSWLPRECGASTIRCAGMASSTVVVASAKAPRLAAAAAESSR